MINFEWNNYRDNAQLAALRVHGLYNQLGNSGEISRSFYKQELKETKECVRLFENQLSQGKLYYTDLQQAASLEEVNLLKELESATMDSILRGNIIVYRMLISISYVLF
jgi:hypothetical protein